MSKQSPEYLRAWRESKPPEWHEERRRKAAEAAQRRRDERRPEDLEKERLRSVARRAEWTPEQRAAQAQRLRVWEERHKPSPEQRAEARAAKQAARQAALTPELLEERRAKRAAYAREWWRKNKERLAPAQRDYAAAYYRERRAELIGKGKASAEKRKAEGVCYSCARPKLEHGLRCERCFYAGIAMGANLSRKLWTELKAIAERQSFRCAYSGVTLIPGDNMSLDHSIPKTAPNYPGDSVLENVVWCTRRVNVAKNNMDLDEFFAMCNAVVQHRMKQE